MKTARFLALTASAGLAISFLAASTAAVSASAAPRPARVTLRGSAAPALERSHPSLKKDESGPAFHSFFTSV